MTAYPRGLVKVSWYAEPSSGNIAFPQTKLHFWSWLGVKLEIRIHPILMERIEL
jgi:hypothetical protein